MEEKELSKNKCITLPMSVIRGLRIRCEKSGVKHSTYVLQALREKFKTDPLDIQLAAQDPEKKTAQQPFMHKAVTDIPSPATERPGFPFQKEDEKNALSPTAPVEGDFVTADKLTKEAKEFVAENSIIGSSEGSIETPTNPMWKDGEPKEEDYDEAELDAVTQWNNAPPYNRPNIRQKAIEQFGKEFVEKHLK